tara:strand:- start:1061 stop:1465 length:405 start_codon:yes stop_codon:yes gene_type:complete
MPESRSHITTKETSPKSFGILFSIVFFIVAVYYLINTGNILIWAIVLSVLFLILAIIAPSKLSPLNKLWFKFGNLLGSLIAPVLMALIYFTLVLPIGCVFRLLGKDLLNQKIDKSVNSYWIVRTDPLGSMKNQF